MTWPGRCAALAGAAPSSFVQGDVPPEFAGRQIEAGVRAPIPSPTDRTSERYSWLCRSAAGVAIDVNSAEPAQDCIYSLRRRCLGSALSSATPRINNFTCLVKNPPYPTWRIVSKRIGVTVVRHPTLASYRRPDNLMDSSILLIVNRLHRNNVIYRCFCL